MQLCLSTTAHMGGNPREKKKREHQKTVAFLLAHSSLHTCCTRIHAHHTSHLARNLRRKLSACRNSLRWADSSARPAVVYWCRELCTRRIFASNKSLSVAQRVAGQEAWMETFCNGGGGWGGREGGGVKIGWLGDFFPPFLTTRVLLYSTFLQGKFG